MAWATSDAIERLMQAVWASGIATGCGGQVAADTSAAGIARLHSSVVPAARILAPDDFEDGLMSSLVTGRDREALASACQTTMEQLTSGLAQQDITDSTQVQQVCELLCALCDVVSVAMAATEPTTSSSGSRVQGEWTSAFGQHARSGTILQALADATKELNRRVLSRAGEVSEALLMSAALSCRRISGCLFSWLERAAPPASSLQHESRRYKLMGWAIEKGLVCQLAQASLLVWGLDPAPYTARGPQGLQQLTQLVRMASIAADRLALVVKGTCLHHQNTGGDPLRLPIVPLGQQGRGSNGTTPAPYLRLTLVQLAMAQHFRRSAALPPGSVPNQPQGGRAAIAALRAAVQQQLTPSCASQLLQRLAPSFWEVVGRRKVSPRWRVMATQDIGDLCTLAVKDGLWSLEKMVHLSNVQTAYALGPQELQLVMECAELHAASQEGTTTFWHALAYAVLACPYQALVEFATHHGRTLLTLAERSLQAALAASTSAGSSGSSSSSGRSRGVPAAAAATTKEHPWEPTEKLVTCLARCLMGGMRATAGAAASNTYEAKGYPADATWALLDATTAPRLLRLMEALVRAPGTGHTNWELCRALPTHLPEMALFYSSPSTARATLSAVTSMTKWLRGRTLALNMLVECAPQGAGAATAAAAAAVRAAVPGSAGVELSDWVANPFNTYHLTMFFALQVTEFVVQSLVRPAALLDPVTFEVAAAAAAVGAPAGRRSHAWLIEQALLDVQPQEVQQEGDVAVALAPYKAQVLCNPGLVGLVLEQVQQGVGAQQRAATARQAAKLAKRGGGEVSMLMEHLQAMQVGTTSSSSSTSAAQTMGGGVAAGFGGGGAAAAAPSGAVQDPAYDDGSSSGGTNTDISPAAGVPPVTPGDITVAANALLVACTAAGELLGVPHLLEQAVDAFSMYNMFPADRVDLLGPLELHRRRLAAAVQEVAEWAVLLHPLLVQLLPAKQGQVLAGLHGRLVGSSSSSSSSSSGAARGHSTTPRLSSAEVASVLGALQHVVIPGQPGCSNPRCCCLDGVSEGEMKTQVCVGCRGARYCSAACQRAHWKAGHKVVCKAVQAAAQAAAASTEVA